MAVVSRSSRSSSSGYRSTSCCSSDTGHLADDTDSSVVTITCQYNYQLLIENCDDFKQEFKVVWLH